VRVSEVDIQTGVFFDAFVVEQAATIPANTAGTLANAA
jgi:hypothetical protein